MSDPISRTQSLNRSDIWHEPCLLHERWHGNFKWRLQLWLTLNLSRFCPELLILLLSLSCASRSQVESRSSPHSSINACAASCTFDWRLEVKSTPRAPRVKL